MKWTKWLVVVLALCLPSVVGAFEVVPSIYGNNQFLKVWCGFGNPDGGLIGPYGTWNDQDPKHLWGGGIRGQIDVSEKARDVLGKAFRVPEQWWESLDAVGARVYLAHEVGVSDLAGSTRADTIPMIGARLFVLNAEWGYKILDGGRIEGPDGILDKSGFKWFIGISRPFRF